jgi:hypothetical protein
VANPSKSIVDVHSRSADGARTRSRRLALYARKPPSDRGCGLLSKILHLPGIGGGKTRLLAVSKRRPLVACPFPGHCRPTTSRLSRSLFRRPCLRLRSAFCLSRYKQPELKRSVPVQVQVPLMQSMRLLFQALVPRSKILNQPLSSQTEVGMPFGLEYSDQQDKCAKRANRRLPGSRFSGHLALARARPAGCRPSNLWTVAFKLPGVPRAARHPDRRRAPSPAARDHVSPMLRSRVSRDSNSSPFGRRRTLTR